MDHLEQKGVIDLHDHLPSVVLSSGDMTRLYTWTFEDAEKAQTAYESAHPNTIGEGPFFDWTAAQNILELYELFSNGDKSSILKTLHICFSHKFPVPLWCETAYLAAYRAVRFYNKKSNDQDIKSWDDVFEKPYPKNTHPNSERQKIDKSYQVYDRICKIKAEDPSVAIDGKLFEQIGREFGIGGKTTIETFYYGWKNYFEKGDSFPW